MASLHKYWKLKANFRSTSGYKGEVFQGGRVKSIFDEETSRPLNLSASATGFAVSPGGHSPLRHPFVSFFTKYFSSSRILAADLNLTTVYSSQHQALTSAGALSRLFAIPTIHIPLMQSCRYSSLEGAAEFRGSRLEEFSERGLYLLTGQFRGVPTPKEDMVVLKQVLDFIFSGPQYVWKERRLFCRVTTLETGRVLDVEAYEHKAKVFGLLDSRALVAKGIDWFCEGNDDSESEEGEVGSIAHVCSMLRERATMQGLLGLGLVLNVSVAHYLLQPETSVPVVGYSYVKFTSNVGFAGKGSPGLKFEGYHELHNSNDLPRNVDNEGVQPKNLRLLSGACCLPHPKKVKTGGEDAYFICSEEQVVGVADGVGGWADVGVDAGDYARELMLQSQIAVAQEPHGYIDPARVMLRAHAKTKCRGSSTACILALSDNGLQAANLGDSGFMLMRNGRTIFKSSVQQHQFNIPFQLESGGSDPPSAAEVFSLQVAAGDVLVAGTDGLFDNLYDNELMGVVIHSTRAGLEPQVTAQKIVALARERAEDCNRQTPFSTAAQEAGFRFYGGKMDDITVIVSYITTIKSGFLSPLSKP